jgi:hypothetical protein
MAGAKAPMTEVVNAARHGLRWIRVESTLHLEMEMGVVIASRLPRQTDNLALAHAVPRINQPVVKMCVHSEIAASAGTGVVDFDLITIAVSTICTCKSNCPRRRRGHCFIIKREINGIIVRVVIPRRIVSRRSYVAITVVSGTVVNVVLDARWPRKL